jgi:hypothetical protein
VAKFWYHLLAWLRIGLTTYGGLRLIVRDTSLPCSRAEWTMWGPAPQTQDMFVGVPGILATINVVVNGQDKLRYFAATTPPADQARHVQTVCGLATHALGRDAWSWLVRVSVT